MQGLAEVEGNPMKVKDASQRIERDVIPLAKEVSRALGNSHDGGREELFDQELGVNGRDYGYNSGNMMESLIGNSEDMLRESLSYVLLLLLRLLIDNTSCRNHT